VNPIPPLLEAAPPERLVLHGVNWATYEKFLDAVGERRLRVTYDGENLELMAPTWNHEWLKRRVGFVVPFLGVELGIEVQSGGSTTFRREDINRGLEPDDCFYIGAHARQMVGFRVLDLRRDPPPDLAIEIDISRSCLDRADIYARLRVPEIWIADTHGIQAYRLGEDAKYAAVERSGCFPSLPLEELFAFLLETRDEPETRMIALVQAWARRHVGPAEPPAS
jgi:Uma2 family endonuclease